MSTDTLPSGVPDAAARADQEREAAALAQAFSDATNEERKRLARIVDMLPCYVVIINKERRIVFHNKTFEQNFGQPGDKRCYEAIRGQNSPCSHCPPLNPMTVSGTSVMEWVQPKTGYAFRVYSYPFTEGDGTPCVLKAGFNVTSTMRVQQALDLSEQSYRAITDNLSIGIALLDLRLRIKAGNIRLSQWFGEGFRLDRPVCELLQCGEFYGSAAQDLEFACPDCPFQASVEDESSHEKELAVTLPDGKERVMRMVTCPVKPGKMVGKKNQVRAFILMLEDVTNRLRVNQQLQRARKLEAMSTLAGGIAHEINQPLSALHLYASGLQMLLEKNELPPETTQERLSLIMREADKIRGIISHMRALVMQEGRVPLRAVALAPAVDNALALMKQQTEARGVQLLVEVPPDLPMALCHDLQLEQVLINLLANALHALDSTRGQGDKAHHGHPGGAALPAILIRAYSLTENGRIRLEVADSGPGLPKGSERIFDPFYTTKERHEGMGLGLSIVHGLVSLWGGEISAVPRHAELGGAAFLLDLPVAGDEPAQEGGRDAVEDEKEGSHIAALSGTSSGHRSTPSVRKAVHVRKVPGVKKAEGPEGGGQ